MRHARQVTPSTDRNMSGGQTYFCIDCSSQGRSHSGHGGPGTFAILRPTHVPTMPRARSCGAGGVIVTDDDLFAERMRAFINHGENTGADTFGQR